jgi:hypothetical protein
VTLQDGKQVRVYCSDFSGEYVVEGMFLRKGKKVRFCTLDPLTKKWESRPEIWQDRHSWEYVEKKKESEM